MINWRDGDWELRCDPTDGGRIGSVRWRGQELLTQPLLVDGRFQAPARDLGQYETRPVYGFDECWPCLEACQWPGMGREVRDHGELVWLQWESFADGDMLVTQVRDDTAGWRFVRRIFSVRGELTFDYSCTNIGGIAFPMSWAGHVLIPPKAVRRMSLPEFGSLRQGEMHGGGQDFAGGDLWEYLKDLPDGEATFLVLGELSSSSVTLRFEGLNWRWCVEGVASPALGLWYDVGGYPNEGQLARNEFGIEWVTSPACALEGAADSAAALVLQPGEEQRWSMKWEIAEAI